MKGSKVTKSVWRTSRASTVFIEMRKNNLLTKFIFYSWIMASCANQQKAVMLSSPSSHKIDQFGWLLVECSCRVSLQNGWTVDKRRFCGSRCLILSSFNTKALQGFLLLTTLASNSVKEMWCNKKLHWIKWFCLNAKGLFCFCSICWTQLSMLETVISSQLQYGIGIGGLLSPPAARGALVQMGQCSYCEFYNVHFKGYLKEVELKAQQIWEDCSIQYFYENHLHCSKKYSSSELAFRPLSCGSWSFVWPCNKQTSIV